MTRTTRTALLASCIAFAAPATAQAAWLFQTLSNEPDYFVRASIHLSPKAIANGINIDVDSSNSSAAELRAAGVLGVSLYSRFASTRFISFNIGDLRPEGDPRLAGDWSLSLTWPSGGAPIGSIYFADYTYDDAIYLPVGQGLLEGSALGTGDRPCAPGRSSMNEQCSFFGIGGDYAAVNVSSLVDVPAPAGAGLFGIALAMLGFTLHRRAKA